jgi:MFS family permease
MAARTATGSAEELTDLAGETTTEGTQHMEQPGESQKLKMGWLNRNVVGMGFTSFLSDASHEMATAVLPAFLASLGSPPVVLGFIEGVADAVSSSVRLGAGWYSDRLGRRKAICVGGYVLTGVSKAVFALAYGWPLVLAGRVIGWFGRGIRRPLRDAMLADSVPAAAIGKAFGFERAGDTLGAIVGPLLAVVVLSLFQGDMAYNPSQAYRPIFVLTLIPGLGAALAFGLIVRETKRPRSHHRRFWATVRNLPASYQRFLVGVGIFGIADFAHTLLILRATELLAPAYGVAEAAVLAVLLYTGRNVLYTVAAYPIGALSDRVGRRGLLASGYLLAVVMCAGFLLPLRNFWFLLVLFVLAGIYVAAEDALEGAIAADLLPEDLRGIGYGILGTVNGVGDLVSSIIVGLLWTHVSVAAGFLYAAVLGAIGSTVILRLR